MKLVPACYRQGSCCEHECEHGMNKPREEYTEADKEWLVEVPD